LEQNLFTAGDMKSKDMSIENKAKIMCWAADKISTKEIAARLGVHPSTIRRHLAVLRELPPTASPPANKPRSGRPRIATFVQETRLRNHVLRHPFKAARELKKDVAGWGDKQVRFIQKTLQKRLNMPSRSAAQKPLLTSVMKKKRLAFAKKYQSWSEKDWMKVMFSDESTFRLINPRAAKVRRPSTVSRYKQRFTISTVKHSPSVMVWGCFSGRNGRGSLYFLPKGATMNGDRYTKVVQEKLVPFMRIHGTTFFLQDGAPCHKCKKVMAVLKEYKEEFSVLDWPGNSPDLNPIENCWSVMKMKFKNNKEITSLPKLILAIKEMWVKDMTPEYFKKLASSMPKRLKMVLQNKGDMTKY
jgi:transposase